MNDLTDIRFDSIPACDGDGQADGQTNARTDAIAKSHS